MLKFLAPNFAAALWGALLLLGAQDTRVNKEKAIKTMVFDIEKS
jgi:hypothetical protein